MSALFEPMTLRGITIPNRVWVSPMCQYSSDTTGPATGTANSWHRTHLISRAIGGAGLVMTEAVAVEPAGRITAADLGIWNDDQVRALTDITDEIRSFGSIPAIQLAHAGRKASTAVPWEGGRSLPADDPLSWTTIGPSAVPFGSYTAPRAMSDADIAAVVTAFGAAAARAVQAGFEVIEIHAAHGYLLHQFLSPESNRRTDGYGGSFDGRIRLVREVVTAVRDAVPSDVPLLVRVSATDWVGEDLGVDSDTWTADQTVLLARGLRELGVDLIDVSTGGNTLRAQIPVGPGYQVPFARRVQNETDVPAAAVGMITEPRQAENIIADGDAEAVFLARELLRDPYWPRRAARELGAQITPAPPPQYARAF